MHRSQCMRIGTALIVVTTLALALAASDDAPDAIVPETNDHRGVTDLFRDSEVMPKKGINSPGNPAEDEPLAEASAQLKNCYSTCENTSCLTECKAKHGKLAVPADTAVGPEDLTPTSEASSKGERDTDAMETFIELEHNREALSDEEADLLLTKVYHKDVSLMECWHENKSLPREELLTRIRLLAHINKKPSADKQKENPKTATPQAAIIPEGDSDAAESSEIHPLEETEPQQHPESKIYKHAQMGKSGKALETEMAQQLCTGLQDHWVMQHKLVSAIHNRVRQMSQHCSRGTKSVRQVIRLADEIRHQIVCRAHKHHEYAPCSNSDLGVLSEDEGVHSELVQLPEVKSMKYQGGPDGSCEPYRSGKVGTSGVKGFERNKFYRIGRRLDLLANCMCKSHGEAFCGSRTDTQLEAMSPTRPVAGLVQVKKERKLGAKLKKRMKKWKDSKELKNGTDLAEAFEDDLSAYDEEGQCPNPFDYIQDKEDDTNESGANPDGKKKLKRSPSSKNPGKNGFGKWLKKLGKGMSKCEFSAEVGCKNPSEFSMGLSCEINGPWGLIITVDTSISNEEIGLTLYASVEGYPEFYEVFSQISFVENMLNDRGFEADGYKFGWASYNFKNKEATIGAQFPLNVMNVGVTIKGEAVASFAESHGKDICSQAVLSVDIYLHFAFFKQTLWEGNVFRADLELKDGKIKFKAALGDLKNGDLDIATCVPRATTPRIHCQSGYEPDELRNNHHLAFTHFGTGHKEFTGVHEEKEKSEGGKGLTLNQCIERCHQAGKDCLGIKWHQQQDYYAPDTLHECRTLRGDVTGITNMPADWAMCIKPCPAGYQTQNMLTGNDAVKDNIFTAGGTMTYAREWPGKSLKENIAAGKPTAQSSTDLDSAGYSGHIAGKPFTAVDGNVDNNFWAYSCTHTKIESNPWWRVDLQNTFAVDTVTVFGAYEYSSHPSNNFEVKVGDRDRWDSSTHTLCGGRHSTRSSEKGFVHVHCSADNKGRYVFIVLPGRDKTLYLCEVRVTTSSEKLLHGKVLAIKDLCDETLRGQGGKYYRGCQTVSRSGKKCQPWAATWPVAHERTPWNSDYAGDGLESNYCRNPDDEETIWCYTMPTNYEDNTRGNKNRWDFCDPKSTSLPPPPPPSCVETLSGTGGKDYRGCQSVTKSGRECQAWAKQWPHKHSRTAGNHPDDDLKENYCRNPDGEKTIWCYTMDSDKRWEECEPKMDWGRITPVDKGDAGCTSSSKCAVGEGDCDEDSDCKEGLKCFQRQHGEDVPGFDVEAMARMAIWDHDFCYDPSAPTWKRKVSREECGEECDRRTAGSVDGTCVAFKYDFVGSPKCVLLMDAVHQNIVGKWRSIKEKWSKPQYIGVETPGFTDVIDEQHINCIKGCPSNSMNTLTADPNSFNVMPGVRASHNTHFQVDAVGEPHGMDARANFLGVMPKEISNMRRRATQADAGAPQIDQDFCNEQCCLDERCSVYEYDHGSSRCRLSRPAATGDSTKTITTSDKLRRSFEGTYVNMIYPSGTTEKASNTGISYRWTHAAVDDPQTHVELTNAKFNPIYPLTLMDRDLIRGFWDETLDMYGYTGSPMCLIGRGGTPPARNRGSTPLHRPTLCASTAFEVKTHSVAAVDKGGSCTSSSPCAVGEGDCDTDSDCKTGLKCFQRQRANAYEKVPGVGSLAKMSYDMDFCYDPKAGTAGCTTVGNGCVQSNGYPSNYGNGESCTITAKSDGNIHVVAFSTEGGYDKLKHWKGRSASADGESAGESFVSYRGWPRDSTTFSAGTSSCNEAEYRGKLKPGEGWYYDPSHTGGWCRTIFAYKVAGLRASYPGQFDGTSGSGYTYLPRGESSSPACALRWDRYAPNCKTSKTGPPFLALYRPSALATPSTDLMSWTLASSTSCAAACAAQDKVCDVGMMATLVRKQDAQAAVAAAGATCERGIALSTLENGCPSTHPKRYGVTKRCFERIWAGDMCNIDPASDAKANPSHAGDKQCRFTFDGPYVQSVHLGTTCVYSTSTEINMAPEVCTATFPSEDTTKNVLGWGKRICACRTKAPPSDGHKVVSDFVGYRGWPRDSTTFSIQTSPCKEAEYRGKLKPGEGWYYDPLSSGKGWCRTIFANKVAGLHAAYLVGQFDGTSGKGVTWLPTSTDPTKVFYCPSKLPWRYPGTNRCFEKVWSGNMCNVNPSADTGNSNDRQCKFCIGGEC